MTNDIYIIRGTSKKLKIYLADANGLAYSVPAGGRLLFGVKEKATDTSYQLLKVITVFTEDCAAVIELDPADTIDLKVQRYLYDVGLEVGEDYYNIIETSVFMVRQNITKKGDSIDESEGDSV